MAETILIDVELNTSDLERKYRDVVASIDEMKRANVDLRKEIKAGNDVNGENTRRLQENTDALKNAQANAKGLANQIKLLNADNKTYGNTLNDERQKLKDLQSAYDSLTQSERENTEIGGKFMEQIENQNRIVKGLEESTGRFQRNVGNYKSAVSGLGGAFQDLASGNIVSTASGLDTMSGIIKGGAIPSFKAFTKAILANPLGLLAVLITKVVQWLGKLGEAFKKSDQAGTSMAKLFAVFQPLIDGVGRKFVALAEGIGKVADKLATWIGGMNDGVKQAQDLVIAIDNLEQAERDYTEQSAKRNVEIAKLRDKAMQKDKYTAEERRKALQEAIDLQKQNLEEEKRIAAEHLRILEEQAKREGDTSDATADKISQARAKMYDAEAKYYNGVKELNGQISELNRQIVADEEATRKAIEEAVQKRIEARNKERAETLKLRQELEDLIVAKIQDGYARELAEVELQGKRVADELRNRLENEKTLTAEQYAILSQILIEQEEATQAKLGEIRARREQEEFERQMATEQERLAKLDELRELAQVEEEDEVGITDEEVARGLGLTLSGLEYFRELKDMGLSDLEALREASRYTTEDMLDAYGTASGELAGAFQQMDEALQMFIGQSEEASKASKAFALASILASQAQSIAAGARAISEGIASAAGLLFPANIPAILSVVAQITTLTASVASSIAQAKQILSQADAGQFAEGGIVGGSSYRGDKMIAHVNSGEAILTQPQQARLLSIADGASSAGGIDYSRMAEAMAQAVASQPAPVMVYEEFNNFQNKVTTYNELSRL